MKNDDNIEIFNELSSLSDVHIDNEEEGNSIIGILSCDQNSIYFFLQEAKQSLILFSFLLFISLFIPPKLQTTEISHQFDSKHYPNYTIFAQISNLPKHSIHGFFVSLKFLDFKDYVYKPKNDKEISHYHSLKLKKSFLFTGNLSIQFSNSAINTTDFVPSYSADFQHVFIISNGLKAFHKTTKTDEFILFTDKLPKYRIFSMNMTANARHPRAEKMIIKFYYCPIIYELFDFLVRISLIICILNTTPLFIYSKIVINSLKLFFNLKGRSTTLTESPKLNIQYILTFVLRIITILYLSIPIISGSVSSISFFQFPFFSYIMNINVIVRDLFFSYSLFYIISILRMAVKETELPQYSLHGSSESENVIIDECYDNQFAFLIRPFMLFSPFLILMIVNDVETDFSHSFQLNQMASFNNLISIAPWGFFIFRSLESINYHHILLFFVFDFFFISAFNQLKKFTQKNLRLNGNLFNCIKNRYKNYLFTVFPFALVMFFFVLKSFLILTWISSKTENTKINILNNTKKVVSKSNLSQSKPVPKFISFSSKNLNDDSVCKKETSFVNLLFLSIIKIISFEGKTALFSTLSILFPALFTIAMSILHTPSKFALE